MTVISDWKPTAFAVSTSPSGIGVSKLTAAITAFDVTVAPESTSACTGIVWPINWLMNAASSMQRVPKPAVSPRVSSRMLAILPSSVRPTYARTVDWKPCCSTSLFSTATRAAGAGLQAAHAPFWQYSPGQGASTDLPPSIFMM